MSDIKYEMDEYGNVKEVSGNEGASGGTAEEHVAALKAQLSRSAAEIKKEKNASRLGLVRGIIVSLGLLAATLNVSYYALLFLTHITDKLIVKFSGIRLIWCVIEYGFILYCVIYKKYDGAAVFGLVSILTFLVFHFSCI